MAALWAVVWRLLVVGYAIYGIGGAPGAAEGWEDIFEPLGLGLTRVIGIVLLVVIVTSLLPSKARNQVWRWTKRQLKIEATPAKKARHVKAVARPPQAPPPYLQRANIHEDLAKRALERELVALVDEWKLVRNDNLKGTNYGTYVLWERKTSEFISTVLGETERSRFQSNGDETNISLERQSELRIRALERLRDNPDEWRIFGKTRDEIRAAIKARRDLAPQEQIVLAGTPALLSRMLGDDAPPPPASYQAPPRLSFGRARIPRESQQISLGRDAELPFYRPGRVIQIPVTNTQGAPALEAVHAQLRFMPDDRDGSFSPRHPSQAEWTTDQGPATRIDLPGNGQAHLFDAVLVLDSGYPCIFEWNRESREAKLKGHEVWSDKVEIEVEVKGSGSTPALVDTLEVEVNGNLLRADWKSEIGGGQGTNLVSQQGRSWPWT